MASRARKKAEASGQKKPLSVKSLRDTNCLLLWEGGRSGKAEKEHRPVVVDETTPMITDKTILNPDCRPFPNTESTGDNEPSDGYKFLK